jgi:hypothetical protein
MCPLRLQPPRPLGPYKATHGSPAGGAASMQGGLSSPPLPALVTMWKRYPGSAVRRPSARDLKAKRPGALAAGGRWRHARAGAQPSVASVPRVRPRSSCARPSPLGTAGAPPRLGLSQVMRAISREPHGHRLQPQAKRTLGRRDMPIIPVTARPSAAAIGWAHHRSCYRGRKLRGFCGLPETRTSKWRCGPVVRPVIPT